MLHTIREALNDGVDEYRLLRGAEPYKSRFANADAPLETVMLASADVARPPMLGARACG